MSEPKNQMTPEETDEWANYLKWRGWVEGASVGIDWAEDSGKSEKEKLLDISSMEFLRQV